MGGPDRLSRADIAEAVARAHGYDVSLIQRVPAVSGEQLRGVGFVGVCVLIFYPTHTFTHLTQPSSAAARRPFPSPTPLPPPCLHPAPTLPSPPLLQPSAHPQTPSPSPLPPPSSATAQRPFPSPADISMDSGRLEKELHLPLTHFEEGLQHIFSTLHEQH